MANFNQRRKDLCGQRFGRLVCVAFDHVDKKTGIAVWKVRCDCGTMFLAYANNLKSGNTRSCGRKMCRIEAKSAGLPKESGTGTHKTESDN